VFAKGAVKPCFKAFSSVMIATESAIAFGVLGALDEQNKEVANEGTGFSKEDL
jgi:hypothetical protein